MSTAITHEARKEIVRPLRILVPLIKEDLRHGQEAAQNAGLPYYRAAGEKMLEAKEQLKHGEFKPWIVRNFKISYSHAHKYMQFAEATAGQKSFAKDFSSLSDFVRKTSSPTYNYPQTVRPQSWHDPVKKIINRVDIETLRDSELKRADEREAERRLALQLIDIGYKTLATKLHPDKGGSRDAMARLNRVRDRLKDHV